MNKANAIKHEAALLCRGSFPATLEENGEPCIVEASIYRLNAVAAAGLHISPETMQQILKAFDRVAEAVKEMARALMEAFKPIIDWAKKTAGRFMEALAAGVVPRRWLHLAKHAKKARTRKKYRNRIRRAVFAALAAEGGGSS